MMTTTIKHFNIICNNSIISYQRYPLNKHCYRSQTRQLQNGMLKKQLGYW